MEQCKKQRIAIRSEQDAQKAHEESVKKTNASTEAKSKDTVDKSEIKVKKESELEETKEIPMEFQTSRSSLGGRSGPHMS